MNGAGLPGQLFDAAFDAAFGTAFSATPGTAFGAALPGRELVRPLAPAARVDVWSAASERLPLADGRCVRIRRVRPADVAAEQAFVAALSPQSRRRRFHGAMKQLPTAVLQAMTSIDFDAHVALVAEAGCADGAPRLVADARYVRDETGGAEFAIAVADDWQGCGLGLALLGRLGRHAAARGIGRLRGSVLADNEPMLALMRRLGARVRSDAHDATVVQVSLPA
jgi:acetyltransferase